MSQIKVENKSQIKINMGIKICLVKASKMNYKLSKWAKTFQINKGNMKQWNKHIVSDMWMMKTKVKIRYKDKVVCSG